MRAVIDALVERGAVICEPPILAESVLLKTGQFSNILVIPSFQWVVSRNEYS